MDEYKDITLAEPPAQNRVPQYTHNAIGTFENYKGILLCDRPSDSRMAHGESMPPFLPPGNVEDSVMGLQPSIEATRKNDYARKTYIRKKQLNSAQLAHRKALKALGEQKMKERLDAVERQIDDENRRQQFREQQQQLRAAIRSEVAAEGVVAHLKPGADPERELGIMRPLPEDLYADEKPAPAHRKESLPEIPPAPVSYVKASGSDAGSTPKAHEKPATKKSKPKPKWAMTEDEALEAELKETDDLVKFAESLDYEKYLDDYEIREALSIMRERVDELKAEETAERNRRGGKYANASPPNPNDVSGVYDDSANGWGQIVIHQAGDVIRAEHPSAAWSPATGGKICDGQISGMQFGAETVSGIVEDDGTIKWSHGMVWKKQAESSRRNDGRTPEPRGQFSPTESSGGHGQKRSSKTGLGGGASNFEDREKDWDNASTYSNLSERKRQMISDEAMLLAEKILASSASLKAVHSKTSLARVLEELTHKAYNAEKENGEQPKAVEKKKPEPPVVPAVPPPRMPPNEPNNPKEPGRILLQLKNSQDYVQNLPYLYRCPSI